MFKVTPKCPGKYTIDIFARNIKCKEGFDSRREVRFYVSEALPITDTKISTSDKVFKINEEINFSTKCETSYLRKYNFDVYEPSIKKKIKKSSKDYFE